MSSEMIFVTVHVIYHWQCIIWFPENTVKNSESVSMECYSPMTLLTVLGPASAKDDDNNKFMCLLMCMILY